MMQISSQKEAAIARSHQLGSGLNAEAVVGAALMIFLWFAVAIAAISIDGVSPRSLLIALNAATLLFPIVRRMLALNFDVFEPLVIAVACMFAMMVLRPLADMQSGKFYEHAYDISAGFNPALKLTWIASLAFILGYESNVRHDLTRLLPKASKSFHLKEALWFATALALLGVTLFSIFIVSSGGRSFLLALLSGRTGEEGRIFNSSSGYLSGADQFLVPASFVFFHCFLKLRQKRYFCMTAIVLAPFIFKSIAHGDRIGVVGALFGLPLIWYAWRGKRPSLAVIAVASGLMLVLFNVVRETRVAEPSYGKSTRTAWDGPAAAALSIFRGDDDEMFDVICEEMEVVPRWVPFTHMGVVRDIAARSLPRIVFPDKGEEMDTKLFIALEPDRARFGRGGTATSVVGDLYLDSGWITVVIWMFVLGTVLAGIWEWYFSQKDRAAALLIYANAPGLIIITMRGQFPAFFGSAFFAIGPLILLSLLLDVRRRTWVR